jgi:hypothetical protein
MRALRLQKEAEESAMEKAYRRDFEAARSFDLEDDELFCPFHLLTEDDVRFIASLLVKLLSGSCVCEVLF